ncbi:MAG: c-type cytochrome [Methyloceanibacter sp.]
MLRSFATLAIIGLGVAGSAAFAADDSAKQPESAAQQSAPAASGSPTATAESAPKGTLKSPYPDFAKVADEGHKKFMAAGCNGCHGGGGGGGMGPPLTNEVWVYGKDDDTLFRLIALGSDGLQKQGYARKGSENVVGPMPAMGGVVKSNDDLWKIIAWIRSVNPSSASAAADTARRECNRPGQTGTRRLLRASNAAVQLSEGSAVESAQ